jgi:hypothetical protein
MSIFENPKKVLKKGTFFEVCDENAHKIKKMFFKIVTIFFYIFCKKYLGIFYVSLIYTNDD